MEYPVGQSSSDGRIIVKDLIPLVGRAIGGDNHRAGFITSAKDLK